MFMPLTLLLALPPDVTDTASKSGDGGGFGGILVFILPLVLLFILMPLFNKKDKGRRKRVKELKKHDKVVTSGGILGTIIAVKDDVVTIEVSKGVRMDFKRTSVFDIVSGQPGPATKQTAEARS